MAPATTNHKQGKSHNHNNSNNSNNNNNNNHNGKQQHQRRARFGGRGYYEVQAVDINSGTSKLKKKIRDMERLLRNGKFLANNAEKKLETERALDALKSQLAQAQQVNNEKDTVARYHKIRFIERKKASRKVANEVKAYVEYLNKKKEQGANEEEEDAEEGEEEKELKRHLLDAEIDLYYTILFPRTESYVSLYPSAQEPEDAQTRNQIKEAVRLEIRKLISVNDLPTGIKYSSEQNELDEDKEEEEEEEEEDQDDDDDEEEDDEEKEKENEKDESETVAKQPVSKKRTRPAKPISHAAAYSSDLRARVIAGEKFVAAQIVKDIRASQLAKVSRKRKAPEDGENGDEQKEQKEQEDEEDSVFQRVEENDKEKEEEKHEKKKEQKDKKEKKSKKNKKTKTRE